MGCRVILSTFVMFWCLQTFIRNMEWNGRNNCRYFWIKASQLIPLALYSGWHVLYTEGFGRFGQGQSSTPEGVFPGWASTDERWRFGGVMASDLWWAGAKRCHWNRSRTLWRIQFSTSLWKAAGQGLRRLRSTFGSLAQIINLSVIAEKTCNFQWSLTAWIFRENPVGKPH